MSRHIAMLCAAAALLLACAATVFADPPDLIILSKPGVFGSLSRAPVRFTHKDHKIEKRTLGPVAFVPLLGGTG